MDFEGLTPSGTVLLIAVALDVLFGDPAFSFHPIRLIGRTLSSYEKFLRKLKFEGYGGGCLLFVMLTLTWVVVPSLLVSIAGLAVHVLVLYFLLALRDLVDHVRAVDAAARRNDLAGARQAIARLAGRDTETMDLAACRRAAIESLAENFVDGFLSPVFWYVLLGLPGVLLFKVVSTMDSMVGYKTNQYLRFGWCGARLDDLMNYIPARLAWMLLGLSAVAFPRLSAVKGWQTGLKQHAILPGPNPGWSEATMAGVLNRRLIGPIWKNGELVTKIWIGDPTDPEGGDELDVRRALSVTVLSAALAVLMSVLTV